MDQPFIIDKISLRRSYYTEIKERGHNVLSCAGQEIPAPEFC